MAEVVGWVERSEPHHRILGDLVGLAALDPPYAQELIGPARRPEWVVALSRVWYTEKRFAASPRRPRRQGPPWLLANHPPAELRSIPMSG